jgi:hypothetical protein
MTFMPKILKNRLEDMPLNDQNMAKTQPNGIVVNIFGFSAKRSTKPA